MWPRLCVNVTKQKNVFVQKLLFWSGTWSSSVGWLCVCCSPELGNIPGGPAQRRSQPVTPRSYPSCLPAGSWLATLLVQTRHLVCCQRFYGEYMEQIYIKKKSIWNEYIIYGKNMHFKSLFCFFHCRNCHGYLFQPQPPGEGDGEEDE